MMLIKIYNNSEINSFYHENKLHHIKYENIKIIKIKKEKLIQYNLLLLEKNKIK
jgi:hypothetical protein